MSLFLSHGLNVSWRLCDRKYLQHVADKVSEWTKEEDLKQEAVQLRDVSPAGSPKGTEAQSNEPDV